jgi:hypothetical protein
MQPLMRNSSGSSGSSSNSGSGELLVVVAHNNLHSVWGSGFQGAAGRSHDCRVWHCSWAGSKLCVCGQWL